MVMLSLVLVLAAPALCASAGEIDVSFADKSYQKIFGEDFSWDQRNNEAKYFDVGNYGNRKALRIRIYEGDKTAWEGNPSCPRSELRPRTRDMLKTDTDYTAEWDWQLQQYTPGYKINFMQLYGGAPRNRPNIMLRLGSHNKQGYNVLCEQCSKPGNDFNIPGNAGDDIGKWIKWRVEFRLSASSHGHLRVYHNGKQVYKYSGKTSDGSSHNWKTGLYTGGGHPCKTKNAVAFLSNLKIRPTGSAAGLDSTNATAAESDAGFDATITVYTLEQVAKTGDCGEFDLPSMSAVKNLQKADKNVKVGHCKDAGFSVADGIAHGSVNVRKFKKRADVLVGVFAGDVPATGQGGACYWMIQYGAALECKNGGGDTQPSCDGNVNGTCAEHDYQYCFQTHGAARGVTYEYWTSGAGKSGKMACDVIAEGIQYWGYKNDGCVGKSAPVPGCSSDVTLV